MPGRPDYSVIDPAITAALATDLRTQLMIDATVDQVLVTLNWASGTSGAQYIYAPAGRVYVGRGLQLYAVTAAAGANPFGWLVGYDTATTLIASALATSAGVSEWVRYMGGEFAATWPATFTVVPSSSAAQPAIPGSCVATQTLPLRVELYSNPVNKNAASWARFIFDVKKVA